MPRPEHSGDRDVFSARVVDLFMQVHPLDQIARAGYVLRGVPAPESVAAHSHSVALLALLFVERFPGRWDREKVLTIALIHDLAEAELMDIPMPAAAAHLREAKDRAERAIMANMLRGFPDRLTAFYQEYIDNETPEAHLLHGLDKAQMMLKVLCYERERRGRLDEFWENPGNFPSYGIEPLDALFDQICRSAGRPRPKETIA